MNNTNYDQEMWTRQHTPEVFLPLWAGFSAGTSTIFITESITGSELLGAGFGLTAGVIAFAGLRKFAENINSGE